MEMRKLRFVALLLALLVWTPAFAGSPIKVTFVNPSHPGSEFWATVTSFMRAAAGDLGMELKVVYASKSSDIDRLEYIQLFEREANAPEKPDFMITHFRQGAAKTILDIAEQAGVKTFFFNTEVPADERDIVGLPRENYKTWIGHMYPDDTQAGFDLAEILLREGTKKGLQGEDGTLGVVGLSGNQHSVAALNRNQGLKQAVAEQGQTLLQIVFTKWKRPVADELATKLMQRFPNATIFWSASDDIALGALDAIKKAGKTPGQDMLVGGFDWRINALEAIQAGEMAASGGGHFMEGGWAMVMLYDYANGVDFAGGSAQMVSRLRFLDQSNVDAYLTHFSGQDWDKIDFRTFSKAENPELKEYDFSLAAIFQQLDQ